MMNNAGGASAGGLSGERPGKPARPGPPDMRSMQACVNDHVEVHKMTQAAARQQCEKLTANAAAR